MRPEELSEMSKQTLTMLPTTRRELKEAFNLYAPSIEVLVKYMLAQGLIKETKIKNGKRGRPELLIERKNNHESAKMLVATSPCLGCICSGTPETCRKLDEWLAH